MPLTPEDLGGGIMMMVLRCQLSDVRNGRACSVVLVSGVSQWTSRYRPRIGGGGHDDVGASLSLSKKRPCMFSHPGLRREPEDLSVQTGVTEAVYIHRRDGSTARGQTRRSSLREMLRPRHSTTVIPDTTLLLHTQLAEEAWAWSASARDPGKSQAAHNPEVGSRLEHVPKEAGRIWPSGGGRRLRVAQSGMGTTPQRLGGINRITDGTGRRNDCGTEIVSLAGAHRAHSRCLATGGMEAALAKASKDEIVSMGGHLRGRMTRAGGKADERIKCGGCTLSRETVAMKSYQQRTPDSSGGIKSSTDRYPNQCDCRPGGVLSSGMARIGANGRAGTSGEAGPQIFESMPRPLAAAGMLPQGRLAGEHPRSFCFYVIGFRFAFDRNHRGSSSIIKIALVSAW